MLQLYCEVVDVREGEADPSLLSRARKFHRLGHREDAVDE